MNTKHLLVKSWLQQAAVDLKAGKAVSDNVSECHRRYWLQQACEKCIKAFGILLWDENIDDSNFKNSFLTKHSPLKNLRERLVNKELSNQLFTLNRHINSEINSLEGKDILLKIDATTPTTDVHNISYRSPFVNNVTGKVLAPVDYT